MKNYLDLVVKCKNEGIDVFNERTKRTCRTLVGATLEYNLADGFPAVTSKKLAFKTMTGELLGFFRGYDSAEEFRSLGCKIWDKNANTTQAWLDNPYRKGEDDLGRIYGKQWINWTDRQVVDEIDFDKRVSILKYLEDDGYTQVTTWFNSTNNTDGSKKQHQVYLMEKSINQLEKALHTIITNPSDRRIIVSAWNPGELDKAALPPCHIMYTFIVIDNTLSIIMHQRSCDSILGIPFNIGSTALFLSIMARLAGLAPGKVILQMVNFHIYENHYDALEEQLGNELFDLPTLMLSDNIKPVSIDEIPGVFTRINLEDIWLENYKSAPAIFAEMAE